MTTNSIRTTLEIIEAIRVDAPTMDAILVRFQISLATGKRMIAHARELGADIAALNTDTGWRYELRNADEIALRLAAWLDCERSQSLRRPLRRRN